MGGPAMVVPVMTQLLRPMLPTPLAVTAVASVMLAAVLVPPIALASVRRPTRAV